MEKNDTIEKFEDISRERETEVTDYRYHAALSKGRNGRLGIGEKISLSHRGKQDAKNGLLRETEKGWSSPALAGEKAAYEEFCAKTWASHQIAMKKSYEEAGSLKERILRLKEEISEAEAEIEELENVKPEFYRKFGEDNVSETQVRARREREHDSRVREKVQARKELGRALAQDREELDRIRNRILEADHAVRMICEKAGEHTKLRMAAYWNAAVKKHAEANRIPAVPDLELANDAERVYLSGHKEFHELIPQEL